MDGMDRTRGYHSCRILSLCTPYTCDCMILPAHVETPNHRPVPSRRVASRRMDVGCVDGAHSFERARGVEEG